MQPRRVEVYGPGTDESYDVFEPAGPPAGVTVALVHGGMWSAQYDRHHLEPLAAALTREGWHVANVEYTRLGHPGGGWPGTGDSLLRGLQAVCADPDLPHPVVCLAHSAGGHLAVWAASEGRCDGLAGIIALSAVLDLRSASQGMLGYAVGAFLGGTPAEVPDAWAHADPTTARLTVPAVVLHGLVDELVPDSQASGYVASRTPADAPSRLGLIEGAGHFEVIDPGHAAYATVRAAVAELAGANGG